MPVPEAYVCKPCMRRNKCKPDCLQPGCACRKVCADCRSQIDATVRRIELLMAEQISLTL